MNFVADIIVYYGKGSNNLLQLTRENRRREPVNNRALANASAFFMQTFPSIK